MKKEKPISLLASLLLATVGSLPDGSQGFKSLNL